VGYWRRGLVIAFLGAIGATVCLGSSRAAEANQLITITIPDRHGEIPSKWMSYPGPPRARVLLPDGYSPRRAYPLLVMLNGAGNNYATFTDPTELNAQQILTGLHAIVLFPEGAEGWYADWWNNGAFGTPKWESYVLDEVIPQALHRFKILPKRRYHALFGISMGGLGAAYLGGRLPGFFGSVGVLSGFVDLQVVPAVVTLGMDAVTGVLPGSIVGPEDGFYATGHNPTALAANLAYTRVFMTAGDGTPSSGDDLGSIPVGGTEEATIIRPMSNGYASALRAAGIDVVYHTHAGCHCWPDFRSELRDAIAWGPFKPIIERPAHWVNETVATHGQLWDIGYRFATPPAAVVRFSRTSSRLQISAARSSVTLTTSGGCLLQVATPADVTIPSKACASSRRRHRGHRRRRRAHRPTGRRSSPGTTTSSR
jgi:S-formylglutathione hydrolase FrmB